MHASIGQPCTSLLTLKTNQTRTYRQTMHVPIGAMISSSPSVSCRAANSSKNPCGIATTPGRGESLASKLSSSCKTPLVSASGDCEDGTRDAWMEQEGCSDASAVAHQQSYIGGKAEIYNTVIKPVPAALHPVS